MNKIEIKKSSWNNYNHVNKSRQTVCYINTGDDVKKDFSGFSDYWITWLKKTVSPINEMFFFVFYGCRCYGISIYFVGASESCPAMPVCENPASSVHSR